MTDETAKTVYAVETDEKLEPFETLGEACDRAAEIVSQNGQADADEIGLHTIDGESDKWEVSKTVVDQENIALMRAMGRRENGGGGGGDDE